MVEPPGVVSLDEAHAAIELWEHYARKVLDPAQRLTVEVMMAVGAGDRWAAATTGREMPRQNGKGDEVEVVELWGLVQRSEAILHTVHDAVLLASQAQQRMLGVLEGHGDLGRLVKRKWRGTGQQMIELRNGGVIWYRTRTGGGGRGVDDIDRLVIDEAQHATEEHLAAVAPTLLANSNPQMNVLGTAGLAGRSDWWWSVRKRALSPDPGAFGYVGHTAEDVRLGADGMVVQPPVDVNDRDLWLRANPSVIAGRGQGMTFLEEQLRRLGPASFAREHLGVWDPEPGAAAASVIPADAWAGALDAGSSAGDPVAIAVDISLDRAHASIAVAGRRPDGRTHVEVVPWCRDVSSPAPSGVSWVLPRLRELVASWHPCAVVVDNKSGADSLLVGDHGLGSALVTTGVSEMGQACGRFFDAVKDGEIRHIGQRSLDHALVGAASRPLGDRWAWSRRTSSVDITPLVAVTLAVWGLGMRGLSDVSMNVW